MIILIHCSIILYHVTEQRTSPTQSTTETNWLFHIFRKQLIPIMLSDILLAINVNNHWRMLSYNFHLYRQYLQRLMRNLMAGQCFWSTASYKQFWYCLMRHFCAKSFDNLTWMLIAVSKYSTTESLNLLFHWVV